MIRRTEDALRLEARSFPELSLDELHDLLALRAEVFVVEQACPYLDPDGRDRASTHLLGSLDGRLDAYARWYPEAGRVRLGRIATSGRIRGRGHGRRLVEEALRRIGEAHPGLSVYLHAQAHLQAFYRDLGFRPVGEPFEEDGIPHVAMVRDSG